MVGSMFGSRSIVFVETAASGSRGRHEDPYHFHCSVEFDDFKQAIEQ